MKKYKVSYMECFEGTPEIMEGKDEKEIRKNFAEWKRKEKESYSWTFYCPPAIKIISIKEEI